MRKQPVLGGHACLTCPFRGADEERGRLVHGPLAGVPLVVGKGERAVVRSGRGNLRRVAVVGERGLGIAGRHGVVARPQRSHLVALPVAAERPRAARQRVLDQRVLLDRRPHHTGRQFHWCHEFGWARQHLVGRGMLLVSVGAPITSPGPCLGRRRRRRHRRAPEATRSSAWLMTSCWETPISHRIVRARGAPIRPATVRAGSVSDHVPCGTAMQSTPCRSPAAPASAAAAVTASVRRSTVGAAWSTAPSPTRTGRRESRERIDPATTLDATVPP